MPLHFTFEHKSVDFKYFYEFCWIFVAYGGAEGFTERPVWMDARQNCGKECTDLRYNSIITNSDLNRPCFAWHPYGKLGLFKTELVIVLTHRI